MCQARKVFFLVLAIVCLNYYTVNAQCECTLTQGNLETTIEPIQGNETAVSFYQYNTPSGASSNTSFEQADYATIFLYEDTNTGVISLIIIFDSAGQGDADGGNASIGFNFDCFDDNPTIEFSDDPGEVTGLGGTWAWAPCCTDGAVISGLDCTSTFDLLVNIGAGITNFQWLSGSDNIALNPDVVELPSLNLPITINCSVGNDKDKDGVPDERDLDDDNDGILDTVEGNGDFDGDGVINSLDSDSDNDGIPDAIEACGFGTVMNSFNDVCVLAGIKDCEGVIQTCTPMNSDDDAFPDYLDLDSDNDGCSDAEESGIVVNGTPTVNACGLIDGICFDPENDDWLFDRVTEFVCPPNLTIQCDSDLPDAFVNLTQFLNAGGVAEDDCGELDFELINETVE